MQWNCPHCGIKLSISDESLSTGWAFSRCFKCAGFALIRKAEINVIKVDKAPPGENVLLPEGALGPSMGLISEEATRNLAKHLSGGFRQGKPQEKAQEKSQEKPQEKPMIRPAVLRNSAPTLVPPPFQAKVKSTAPEISLPEPLPEIPSARERLRSIPIGIIATAVLAIISGIYFYIQAQNLWQKARETSQTQYTPQVKESAALEPQKSAAPIAAAPAQPAPAAPAPGIVTDQLQHSASAETPLFPTLEVEKINRLLIKVRARRASLHSGPGMEYAVIGTVNGDTEYSVTDWSDRWFKLSIPNEIPSEKVGAKLGSKVGPVKFGPKFGWIRNDLVQVISEATQGSALGSKTTPAGNLFR